jgi:hypothetical protein
MVSGHSVISRVAAPVNRIGPPRIFVVGQTNLFQGIFGEQLVQISLL